LSTSTLLTLLIVPIVYAIIDRFNIRVGRLFKKNDPKAVDPQAKAAPITH
jgi:hypothetical protein